MKKFKLGSSILVLFAFLFVAQSGLCYTVNFVVDSSIDLSLVDGLDVAVSGLNPLADLTLDIAYTFEGGAVPGVEFGGTIYSDWEGFLTSYGANLNTGKFIPLESNTQLLPDLIAFSLTAAESFVVEKFEINSSNWTSGVYDDGKYIISVGDVADGLTLTASVPIPPAFLLLGGGLLGLLGIRRKTMK